jgi:hypothetical protein
VGQAIAYGDSIEAAALGMSGSAARRTGGVVERYGLLRLTQPRK